MRLFRGSLSFFVPTHSPGAKTSPRLPSYMGTFLAAPVCAHIPWPDTHLPGLVEYVSWRQRAIRVRFGGRAGLEDDGGDVAEACEQLTPASGFAMIC